MKALRAKPQSFALQGKRLSVSGLGLQATDIFLLACLLVLTILTALFHSRIHNPWRLTLKNAAWGFLYLGAIYLHQKASRRFLRFLIRAASVQLTFAYLFFSTLPLQLIIVRNWQDLTILNLEQAVFGAQPTVWIQRWISPALTEWLMFSYIIYLAIYPALAGILYFKCGERPMEDYLFSLSIVNFVCDLGFILFPVAGPMFRIAEQYHGPLKGYVFSSLGEFIRDHAQPVGGCLPSPHCAVATVMGVMAWRYHKPTFVVISPIILSLYVSAFYGRFHYLTDVLAGILAAWLVILIVPSLMNAWNTWLDRRSAGTA